MKGSTRTISMDLILLALAAVRYATEAESKDAEGRAELMEVIADVATATRQGIAALIDERIEAALKEVREEWRVITNIINAIELEVFRNAGEDTM